MVKNLCSTPTYSGAEDSQKRSCARILNCRKRSKDFQRILSILRAICNLHSCQITAKSADCQKIAAIDSYKPDSDRKKGIKKLSRTSYDVQFKEFSLTKQKLHLERTMSELGKPFLKKNQKKNK